MPDSCSFSTAACLSNFGMTFRKLVNVVSSTAFSSSRGRPVGEPGEQSRDSCEREDEPGDDSSPSVLPGKPRQYAPRNDEPDSNPSNQPELYPLSRHADFPDPVADETAEYSATNNSGTNRDRARQFVILCHRSLLRG